MPSIVLYLFFQALNFAFNDLYKTLLLRHVNRDLVGPISFVYLFYRIFGNTLHDH